MGFWFALVVWWFSMGLQRFLQPGPRAGKPEPFQTPTATEGRAIPIVWGTRMVKSPNVLWYGDVETQPASQGTYYWAGLQYGICWGAVDQLQCIYWDEHQPFAHNPVPWPIPQNAAGVEIVFNDCLGLFGGESAEGGVAGFMNFYFGTFFNAADPYLAGQWGFTPPTYAGLCYAVCKHMYLGKSAYLKPIAFEIKRIPNQLGLTNGHNEINQDTNYLHGADANPACMLYELLTDRDWGLGISSGLIDVTNFREVGEVLYAEGMGLSMLIEDQTEAKEIVSEILRHIDAVLYAEPSTGLLTLRLIRADYDPDDLVTLDDSCIEWLELSRPAMDETKNVVRITYVERSEAYREKVAQAQDLASIQAMAGATFPQDLSFQGISNGVQAQKVAARELKPLTYPFARVSMGVNRKAHALKPGEPFKIYWAPLGISGLICRASKLGSGTLTDGKIRIEAAQDVFGVDWTAYSPPPVSGWTDPWSPP